MFNSVGRAMQDVASALKAWHIWSYLAWQDVISKYRRSIFGPLWISGGMIATSLALSITFGAIFRQPISSFLPLVMAGYLTWIHFIGPTLGEAPELFVSVSGSIRNHAFPFMYYVLRYVTRALILLGHSLVVFYVMTLCVRNFHVPNWQIIPALILLTLFTTFLSTVVGIISARYRDLRFMLPYLGQMLFFVTPIFWSPHAMGGQRAMLVHANPFFHLLEVLRQPLLGQPAPLASWLSALTTLAVVFVLWLITFSAFRRKIPFWV